MKIFCETQLINRELPHAKPIRSSKATIAIGLHSPPSLPSSTAVSSTSTSGSITAAPKSSTSRPRPVLWVKPPVPPVPSTSKTKSDSQLFIIHFNGQNKVGQRYKIKDNIQKLYTKFINDGKMTISFKIPEHDLLIKCDPIQLKCFFRIMKSNILCNNKNNNNNSNNNGCDVSNASNANNNAINLRREYCLTTLATTPIPSKLQPVYKLHIKELSDRRINRLPKSLKELKLCKIRLTRFNSGILELNKLTNLNISENYIKQIPKALGNLNLIELNLSSNRLGNISYTYQQKWAWLDGKAIRKSLKFLDISNNELNVFPYNIVRLDNLILLKLNYNKIEKIPFGIRRMKNMRCLHLNENKLRSVPYTLSLLKLEVLDLWGNSFLPLSEFDCDISKRIHTKVQPLWVKAAQTVLNNRIPYSESTIPSLLVDFLTEMPVCICGKLCYSDDKNEIIPRIRLLSLHNVKEALYCIRNYLIYADVVFCSSACFYKNKAELMRI